jgi:sterol 3beta-glucosyltransferase
MRIVVVAVGTRGDVEPHAALCAGLQRAGYDACLCAPNDFACSVAAQGIPFHPIPISFRKLCESEGGGALLASGGHSIRFLRTLGHMAADVAAQVICTVRTACRETDAVCYSPLGLPAFYIARELGIPAFATSLQPLGRTSEYANPLLSLPDGSPGTLNRFSYRLMEQLFWQIARPLLRPQVRDPLPFWGHYNALYRASLPVLFGYSPLVVPRPRDWKPWMHTTGYWRTLAPPPPLPDGLDAFLAGGPAVCFGFGSMHSRHIARIFETAIEMLARTGRRAVILTGWSGYQGRTVGSDSNIFVTDHVPHDCIFSRMSAVVHHGGAGTTAAALRAGVPSIILPFFFDQGFWGRWLAARGLGPPPIAFGRLSSPVLAHALDSADTSDHMRCRLQVLGCKLRQEDGVSRAVTIIGDALDKFRK